MDSNLALVWLEDNVVEFLDISVDQDLLMRNGTISVCLCLKDLNLIFKSFFKSILVHNSDVVTLWMNVELHV